MGTNEDGRDIDFNNSGEVLDRQFNGLEHFLLLQKN